MLGSPSSDGLPEPCSVMIISHPRKEVGLRGYLLTQRFLSDVTLLEKLHVEDEQPTGLGEVDVQWLWTGRV